MVKKPDSRPESPLTNLYPSSYMYPLCLSSGHLVQVFKVLPEGHIDQEGEGVLTRASQGQSLSFL